MVGWYYYYWREQSECRVRVQMRRRWWSVAGVCSVVVKDCTILLGIGAGCTIHLGGWEVRRGWEK
jgi:hypothetical protein